MNILVLNCGSSTVKFQIIETDLERIAADSDRQLARGMIERIGSLALISIQAGGRMLKREAIAMRNHQEAIDYILKWVISEDSGLDTVKSLADIHAVGHRVVHGGERFKVSVRIDTDVLEGIEECIELAPLHNPANLKGIYAIRKILGNDMPQVAIFDTAFHSTMPEVAYLYALPYYFYRRHKIRRYGFHGTSHRYVAYRYRQFLGIEKEAVNIISLHLGNGCSACAIQNGASIDTSMGFTPIEGLVMGTRVGDVDPSTLEYLSHKEGLSLGEIDTILNKQSGLRGISGLTSDMRELLEEEAENQDRRARLAIDMFCRRVRKYIGSYSFTMGGADALVFTGGIGQNSAVIRERICRGLEKFGIALDGEKNQRGLTDEGVVEIGDAGNDAKMRIFVIATNEELLIARDTVRVLQDAPRRW